MVDVDFTFYCFRHLDNVIGNFVDKIIKNSAEGDKFTLLNNFKLSLLCIMSIF